MHTEDQRSIKATACAVVAFSFAIFISLALARYCIGPQWQSMSGSYSRLAKLKNALAKQKEPEVIQTRLITLNDSLESKYRELSRKFGETKDLSGVLRMLIEKANAADIQFIKMQPSSESASGKAGSYPIVLEMTAPYHLLGRFISSLETMPHLVHIDRLAMNAGRNAVLDIRMQVTCFLHSGFAAQEGTTH